MATIEVFKAQIQEHGWAWAQRDDFGFICFDRWLTKKGNYYYLNQGGHKGESIESMMRIDRSYLEWIINKCQWTDDQTRAIIAQRMSGRTENLRGQEAKSVEPSQAKSVEPSKPLKPSNGKPSTARTAKNATCTSQDLSLFD
jgi:hypothetical protein